MKVEIQNRLIWLSNGRSTRLHWWMSLLLTLLAVVWAHNHYQSNLSFFRRDPDLRATGISIFIICLGCLQLFIISRRRANSVSGNLSYVWTIFIPPISLFWIIVLGLLPAKVEGQTSPISRLKTISLFSVLGIASVVGAIFFVTSWLGSGPIMGSPKPEGEFESDFKECVTRGEVYYREIGSFPRFSTGEDTMTEILKRCEYNTDLFQPL